MAVEITLLVGRLTRRDMVGELVLPLKSVPYECRTRDLLSALTGEAVAVQPPFSNKLLTKDVYEGRPIAIQNPLRLVEAIEGDVEDGLLLAYASIAAATLRHVAAELPHLQVAAYWH